MLKSLLRGSLALLAAAALSLAAGCSVIGTVTDNVDDTKLVVQYGTLKYIEQSDDVSAEDALAHIARLRTIVDGDAEVYLADLRADTMRAAVEAGADAADRLLLASVMDAIESAVTDNIEAGLLSPDARAKVRQVLDWAESAARLAG